MKTLILTVGLPRSGKSSWAGTTGFPVVSPDSIRLALHGKPFVGSFEPVVWETARIFVRSLFYSGHETVILDATSITKKRRDQWKSPEWKTVFRFFPTSKKECIRRAEEGGRDYLIPVIKRMERSFEPLGEGEEMYYEED